MWMRQLFLVLALTTCVFGVQAQVYKWTDENGTVHFSAKPPVHQKTEEMRSVSVQVAPALRAFCNQLRGLVPRLVFDFGYATSRNEHLERIGLSNGQLRQMGFTNVDVDGIESSLSRYRGRDMQQHEQARVVEEVYGQCLTGAYGNVQAYEGSIAEAERKEPLPRDLNASGTGFLISSELVATSFHVVEGSHSITLHLSDGSTAKATTLSMDRSKDLAVLKMQRPTTLRFLRVASDTVDLGAEVFTIGFPQPDLMGVEPKLSTGVISSTSGIQDDSRAYQISVPVQAGNSGGPLIDSEGRVVGIVASKLNAAKVFEWTGDLPQNVNYAVKSIFLSRLMSGDVLLAGNIVSGVGIQGKAPAVKEAVVRIEVH
jgi:S1-C subfamily serine protease